jgi:hypothetical protein
MTADPPKPPPASHHRQVNGIENMEFRMEHDLIGDEQVPKHAYYGIQTQRA